jgi:hypothetical protein
MRLFHRTSRQNANEILRDGFRDATDYYTTDELHTGVWLSNKILDGNEGANGDTVLSVDLSEEAIADYEWIEEGKSHREWLIPAAVVATNQVKEIRDRIFRLMISEVSRPYAARVRRFSRFLPPGCSFCQRLVFSICEYRPHSR